MFTREALNGVLWTCDALPSAKLLPETEFFFSEELDAGIYYICFVERAAISSNFF